MPETVDKATDICGHAEDSQEQSEHVHHGAHATFERQWTWVSL